MASLRIIIPFHMRSRIEPLEHIMRGPVAVQAQDCRGTVAQKPQCKLAKIANLCANRVFQPSIKPCVRIAPRICETAVRTSVSTVAPPESDTIAAARLPTLVSHHFAALSLAPLFAHHASSFSKVCGRAARGFRRRLRPGSRLRSRRPSRLRVHDESFKPSWFRYSIIRSFVVAACFAAALLERLLTWLFRLISPRRPQA